MFRLFAHDTPLCSVRLCKNPCLHENKLDKPFKSISIRSIIKLTAIGSQTDIETHISHPYNT